jgi:hypothetical protein
MKASLATSEKYGEEFRKQAASVSETSAQSATEIGRAVAALQAKMTEIGRATNSVNTEIQGAQNNLSTESERFLSISRTALEATRDATVIFGKQSDSLFKAAQDAARTAEDVKKTELQMQRNTFLSATKFIVESLYSLSVDMARMLDGDISEKTWKAFQRGDVSAFARKLAEMGDRFPLEKAREKFASDTEFRTYVQRYIRQFEELYSQALEHDHGAILATTLGTSETARLYQFLCSVAGREPKTAQETLKAA